jgi:hypothetical protein
MSELKKADMKLKVAQDKMLEFAQSYKNLGNTYMYDEMVHVYRLIKEARKEHAVVEKESI